MKWLLNHAVHGDRPWEVQAESIKRSEGHDRYGYFLEQGLGKTSLTLNDFLSSDLPRALVLAPNSFKLDWVFAPNEWGVGDQVGTFGWGSAVKPTYSGRNLVSMNYEAIRSPRGNEFARNFMDEAPTMLIIDESSAIKNHKSQTTKAALDLVRRSKMVRELNGTPIVQNVMDYWPQLRALGELDGVNPYQFRNAFAVLGGFMGKQIVGMRQEEKLYEILDRCSFRALKEDWRDLPPKTYQTVHLEMTAKQRAHYHNMMEDFFTELNGVGASAEMVLTQMGKLRQISSCLLMQGEEHTFIEPPEKNPKVRGMLDVIESGPGKTIVSHFYRPSGDMLYDVLQKEGYEPARISKDPEVTIAEKARFNNDSKCRVILGQVSAISRGHTLIGQRGADRCNRTICYENSFERLHRAHLEDRNHRGEQDQPCVVYDLSTSPMDDVGIDILVAKKNMADGIDKIVAVARKR